MVNISTEPKMYEPERMGLYLYNKKITLDPSPFYHKAPCCKWLELPFLIIFNKLNTKHTSIIFLYFFLFILFLKDRRKGWKRMSSSSISDECGSDLLSYYDLKFHVISLFIILGCSLCGTTLPILGKKFPSIAVWY